MSASFARNHVAPAGGHGEGLLAGVQAEVCGGGEGIDRVRIEVLVVEGNVLSGRGGADGRDLVLVIEEPSGAEAEAMRRKRVIVQRGASRGHIHLAVEIKAVGGDVIGGVVEEVAGSAQVQITVHIGGGLQVDAHQRHSAAEARGGKRPEVNLLLLCGFVSLGSPARVDGWRRLTCGRAGRLAQESRGSGEKCKRQQNNESFHDGNLHGKLKILATGLISVCSCGRWGTTTRLRRQPTLCRQERWIRWAVALSRHSPDGDAMNSRGEKMAQMRHLPRI